MREMHGIKPRIGVLIALLITVLSAGTAVVLIFQEIDDRNGADIIIRDPRLDATMVVDVQGGVATPGTYTMPPGARVGDAIVAAGGTSGGATTDSVNPARLLVDGERIVVPTAIPIPGGTPMSGQPAPIEPLGGLVNINAATATELDTLPGVGPVIAARIVSDRDTNGPFESVDDLDRVSGISPRIVDELRPLVTI